MHLTALSKGSVESLVKWVKGNFLPGRTFQDDEDLTVQASTWQEQAHTRPAAATGEPPLARLAAEAHKGGSLPPTCRTYFRHPLSLHLAHSHLRCSSILVMEATENWEGDDSASAVTCRV